MQKKILYLALVTIVSSSSFAATPSAKLKINGDIKPAHGKRVCLD